MTQVLTIEKLSALQGSVNLIGSKSLTNRALLLSSLCSETTVLHNILRSDDSKVMIDALRALGVRIVEDHADHNTVIVVGINGGFRNTLPNDEPLEIFLGNAGTAMRPLCAALALSSGFFKLTGEPRMYERPIGILVGALRSLGAKIQYLGAEGYPPLLIKGCGLTTDVGSGVENVFSKNEEIDPQEPTWGLEMDGDVSSQFISSLLMVGSLLPFPLELRIHGDLISKPYVTLTCELLKKFGVTVNNRYFRSFLLKPTHLKSPGSYIVEGDATGATYFLAGAAVSGEVTVYGVGKDSIQGDSKFIEILAKMGAKTEVGDNYLKVSAAEQLHGLTIDMNDMPDAAMTLVPLALFTDSPIKLTNIASWRVKETDRIQAMATEMAKFGCAVESGRDYIEVDGRTPASAELKKQGVVPVISTYNDHRMAMSMAITALDRTIQIEDPDCCRKTFPDFFARWAEVSVH